MRKIFWQMLLLMIVAAPGVWAGEFKVAYPEVSNPDYKQYRLDLQQEKTLESLADDLNSVLEIPTDVTLTYQECKTVNAFYNPESQQIIICYELVDDLYDIFSKAGFKDDELDRKVWNDLDYSFYHELGHALIHILDLPITGKEEDAADQLSIYVLLDGSDEGEQAVLDSAVEYLIKAKAAEKSGESLPMWDEHSMDAQRFFNMICWVYGENPEKHENLIKEGALPEDRAARCPKEWEQIDKAWGTLLGPNLKGGESEDQESEDQESDDEGV